MSKRDEHFGTCSKTGRGMAQLHPVVVRRDGMKFHDLANIFPLMEGEAFDGLRAVRKKTAKARAALAARWRRGDVDLKRTAVNAAMIFGVSRTYVDAATFGHAVGVAALFDSAVAPSLYIERRSIRAGAGTFPWGPQ